MKALKFTLLILMLLPLTLRVKADNNDTSGVSYFLIAKTHLENMLNGKEPMSYEEAIYQIENAWYGGGLDYASYKNVLNIHTKNICKLICSYLDASKMNPKSDLTGSAAQKREYYINAAFNCAIYRYITDTSFWIEDGQLFSHKAYHYSTKDPMGTMDWTNTQVTHLLNENHGNCFALASLFKIFSERLNSDARLCSSPGHIYTPR